MRVLVFGQTGQVACELARRCPAGGTARFLGRDQADLMAPSAAIADCHAVINAAA
jgi:dTDP-4-dehydrorhamnose reductase